MNLFLRCLKQNFPETAKRYKERPLPVIINEADLSEIGVQLCRVSARLKAENHLFINGIIRKTNIVKLKMGYQIKIRCSLKNKDGAVIYCAEDPYQKDMNINRYDTFSITIYCLSRFVDPKEIRGICLFCVFTEKHLENS